MAKIINLFKESNNDMVAVVEKKLLAKGADRKRV